MNSDESAYHEVYLYAMGRPGFPLQHVADAYTVQTAGDASKPIGVVFALIGLLLRVERGFSGRRVQQVHMTLAASRREWPKIELPDARGSMTVSDVRAVSAGPDRDKAIDEWCRSVWNAVEPVRSSVAAILKEYGIE